MSMSNAEDAFASLWRCLGPEGYHLVREHQFAPPRRWRFDFAEVAHRLAIEIEGVTWQRRGRHQTARGYQADCEKYNAATMLGWRILRYTPADLKARPVQIIEQIETALTATCYSNPKETLPDGRA